MINLYLFSCFFLNKVKLSNKSRKKNKKLNLFIIYSNKIIIEKDLNISLKILSKKSPKKMKTRLISAIINYYNQF